MSARAVLVSLVFLAAVAILGETRAQSGAAAPDPREGPIRVRIGNWLTARKLLIVKCSVCDGFGTRPVLNAAGSAVEETCPSCSGEKYKVSPTQAEKTFFDYRSPAWRARPTSRSEFNEEFGHMALKDAWQLAPKVSRFDHAEFVDDSHAVVWTKEGEGNALVPSRWILVAEGKAKPQWYCWMEESDGPWPDAQAAPAAAAGPMSPITDLAAALPAGSTWLGSEKASGSEAELSVVMRVLSVSESEATCFAWYPDFNQGVKKIVLTLGSDGALSVGRSRVVYGEADDSGTGFAPALTGSMKADGSALTGFYAFMNGSESVTANWSLSRVGG